MGLMRAQSTEPPSSDYHVRLPFELAPDTSTHFLSYNNRYLGKQHSRTQIWNLWDKPQILCSSCWQHLGDAPRRSPSQAHPLCVGPYTLYGVACAPGTAATVPHLPAFWWVLLLWDENPRFDRIPNGSRILVPKQAVSLSFFFGFGESTPINRNSKLYAGSHRTYNRRQGEIQARKRYGQANAMKGIHIFRVRLCVTAGRRLWIQANLPVVPIHAPDPLAGPRATVAKATERKNETGGNESREVRKIRQPW
jgi:hypothetical protein